MTAFSCFGRVLFLGVWFSDVSFLFCVFLFFVFLFFVCGEVVLTAVLCCSGVVPIVDFEPFLTGTAEDKATVAAELGEACEHIGFFVLSGHQVSWGVCLMSGVCVCIRLCLFCLSVSLSLFCYSVFALFFPLSLPFCLYFLSDSVSVAVSVLASVFFPCFRAPRVLPDCVFTGVFVAQVAPAVIDNAWSSTQQFFDMDNEYKASFTPENEAEYPYGYSGFGAEILSAGLVRVFPTCVHHLCCAALTSTAFFRTKKPAPRTKTNPT